MFHDVLLQNSEARQQQLKLYVLLLCSSSPSIIKIYLNFIIFFSQIMSAFVAQSRLGRILVPAMEKIIKNAAWRKHAKLVQDCKAAMEKLSSSSSSPSSNDPSPLFDGSASLSPEDAELMLRPLMGACASGSPRVVEPALDAIQTLISIGHLRGEADSGNGDELLTHIIHASCQCHTLGDELVELLVLKTLLTAVSSFSLHVHGESLLNSVRTCYHICLASKFPVTQITAKACLIQMVFTVFRRMEADSSTVPVQPVVVADLFDPPLDSNMTQFAQSFITRVVQDIEIALHPSPSRKSLGGHGRGFDAIATETKDHATSLESNDNDMVDAKYWEISMYKNALEGRKGDLAEEDIDKEGDLGIYIPNKLRRDAFLVFRALCKLSMKSSPQEGTADPLSPKGKIVTLELLKMLLENAGTVFRTNESFLGAIKQFLCLSLLKNSASPMINIFQLSCSIFISLITKFRAGLKAEIGVLFPMIVLRVLDNVAQSNLQQKMLVLHFVEKLYMDSQILVDIFMNYDCDVDSLNIFERIVNGLLKTAQGIPSGATTSVNPVQEGTIKLTAMKCLVGVLLSIGDWMNKKARITDSQYQKTADSHDIISENGNVVSTAVHEGSEDISNASEARNVGLSETSEAAKFEQRRAYKLELQEGISLFNKKPGKGIDFLMKAKKVGNSPEEISAFLKNASGLDKTMIGDYLGENDEFSLKVMHAYVDSFNFQEMEFDEAIRMLLLGFRLPGEAQKIDRIMEKFAERYCKCNPKRFTSADTAYVLAYSVILLNTDAHNPTVKNKMSKADFLQNNRGIDDGKDLSEDFLGSLYDRIVKNEIKMKEDDIIPLNKQPTNVKRLLGLDTILNIVIRKRGEEKILQTGDDVGRQFKEKTGKSQLVFYPASDLEILRPMVEVAWAPMLAAFSVSLEQSDDEVIISQCLEGFRHAVHITAVMHMQTQRDAFLTSLAKFTSLHSAADIKQKNIHAIKAIISVADEDGNYLHEAWGHILTCVSRFEHLHLMGEGVPPDATFFAAPPNESEKLRQAVKSSMLPMLRRKGPGRLQYAAAAARRGSYDTAGVGGHATGIVTTEQMNNLVTNLNMLEQIGSSEMNRIFTRSIRLNSEAIIEFVKALCKVSMEELQSPTEPRVFSLTKIVEIAHFNMNRIRLVWSHIWVVLSDFFVNIGCSENLWIAMFAIDSLRQLAIKFLEREELANYNFQNELMKPFVIVMRKSSAVEIRELIIRCVSQMVLARVKNVKSGWKIMFMVFTIAATDDHKSIVLLGFETIEKIVRDCFEYITETETTTFTDCVNCLIAFTNNRFSQDISIKAIVFLRFCAMKLAEGEIGVGAKEKEKDKEIRSSLTFTNKDDSLYCWFPLLAGLSELTFDLRPDIRKTVLEVLFDTLRNHGHLFIFELWECIFHKILFPIFYSVRDATDPSAQRQQYNELDCEQREVEIDAWQYETCTLALQLVVDLVVKFYSVVNPLLEKILQLLTGFVKRPHQSLSAIAVAAFVRLVNNAGAFFSEEKWLEVLVAVKEAASGTLPDMHRIDNSLKEFQMFKSIHECNDRDSNSRRDYITGVQETDSRGVSTKLQFAILEAKSCITVQLLLVQAVNEIYNVHGSLLSATHTMILLDTLHEMAVHAHNVNSDFTMRRRLQKIHMITQIPDPPLLRLESESYQAYLTLLLNIPLDNPSLSKDVDLETRLVELCEEVLQVYLKTARAFPQSTCQDLEDKPLSTIKNIEVEPNHPLWIIPFGSSKRRELVSRAPLVIATLNAISGLKDSSFEKYLIRFFPLFTNLISCEHGSSEVLVALSDMFDSWIGPIFLQVSLSAY